MHENLLTSERFQETAGRFDAWWRCEVLDRPIVTIQVKPSRAYQGPVSTHATLRERKLDVDFTVRQQVAMLRQRDFVADSFPLYWPNIGPEVTATLYGCELEFGEWSSWSTPIIHEMEQWERILHMRPDFQNPYWQWIERATDLALELSQGQFIVGITDLHGNYDVLAALRDPQMLCMDLVDIPELIDRLARHVSDGCNDAFNRSYAKVAAAGMGSSCWVPFYHRGPAYSPNCDFWCMVSGDVAENMVLPRIVQEMEPLQRSIFHLDGPGALRHLDLLLSVPEMHAIQWVYGDGHGPASEWMNVYRRIRKANRAVQVMATDMADALRVAEEIGPDGLWLWVHQPAETVAEVEEFLQTIKRRT
jgi:hypothetical protein